MARAEAVGFFLLLNKRVSSSAQVVSASEPGSVAHRHEITFRKFEVNQLMVCNACTAPCSLSSWLVHASLQGIFWGVGLKKSELSRVRAAIQLLFALRVTAYEVLIAIYFTGALWSYAAVCVCKQSFALQALVFFARSAQLRAIAGVARSVPWHQWWLYLRCLQSKSSSFTRTLI